VYNLKDTLDRPCIRNLRCKKGLAMGEQENRFSDSHSDPTINNSTLSLDYKMIQRRRRGWNNASPSPPGSCNRKDMRSRLLTPPQMQEPCNSPTTRHGITGPEDIWGHEYRAERGTWADLLLSFPMPFSACRLPDSVSSEYRTAARAYRVSQVDDTRRI
jgi:hypothetical protein